MIREAIEAAIGCGLDEINKNSYDVGGFALGTDDDTGTQFLLLHAQ